MKLWHRTAVLLVVAATTVLLPAGISQAAGHIHVEPNVTFALPPATAGCTGATALAGGGERLPITVSTVAGQVAELLNVCIEGKGPYPFVIDTGAGESIIDAHLASTLGLANHGQASEFAGVGCTGHAQPVLVPSWSMVGVPLAAQTLTAATLPDFGTKGEPVGLLGSDVLSRYGAVRIDFSAQTLTLGGPEGPVAQPTVVHGPRGSAPSAVLTEGQKGITIPVTVVMDPGQTSLNVRLTLGRGRSRFFVVDTGSSQSVVASAIAKQSHLAHTDLAQRQDTVCSVITAPLVRSGPWSIPGVTLRPQLLGETNFGSISADGTAGLLGSDQLKHFGWVIFDYRGGRLVLG